MRNRALQYISLAARLLVGAVFVFSGFVKVIDPLGTTYKIEDYLHAFGGVFANLDVLAFPAAMLLVTFEFVLGLMLLFHVKPKATPWLLLIFMLVMTPLTLYLAIYNPVSDCGCFGDALILTNWQTFWKNIVLCVLLALIFLDYNHVRALFVEAVEWVLICLFVGVSIAMSVVCLRHLPWFDFRPYKVGTNIIEGMEVPDDSPASVYKTTFIYEKNGEQKEFTLDNYPRNDSTWTFVDQRSELISKGYEPPIHDFQLVTTDDEYTDITDDILNSQEPVALIIMYDLKKSNVKLLNKHAHLLKSRYEHLYIVTGSPASDIERFVYMQNVGIDVLTCDPVTLKTIVRANPGVIVIEDGIVKDKFNLRDIKQ